MLFSFPRLNLLQIYILSSDNTGPYTGGGGEGRMQGEQMHPLLTFWGKLFQINAIFHQKPNLNPLTLATTSSLPTSAKYLKFAHPFPLPFLEVCIQACITIMISNIGIERVTPEQTKIRLLIIRSSLIILHCLKQSHKTTPNSADADQFALSVFSAIHF